MNGILPYKRDYYYFVKKDKPNYSARLNVV
jgi:hypothetical protein